MIDTRICSRLGLKVGNVDSCQKPSDYGQYQKAYSPMASQQYHLHVVVPKASSSMMDKIIFISSMQCGHSLGNKWYKTLSYKCSTTCNIVNIVICVILYIYFCEVGSVLN